MSYKNPPLVNGEIYHVVLRAVGDTSIFNDKNDLYRGIFSLYEFNNSNSVSIWLRRQQRKKEKLIERTATNITKIARSDLTTLQGLTSQGLQVAPERNLFVEILAFCLMPNHIHLLLRQIKDKGISQFMQKLGTGYAVYFNKKNDRKGHLLNKFKAIHIKTTKQLQNGFVYCHTNPLSLIEPGWKEKGIEDLDKAIKFLEKGYRWSSLPDFIGKKNFPSVTVRDFLLEVMGGEEGCRNSVRDWIRYKKELKDLGNIVLE